MSPWQTWYYLPTWSFWRLFSFLLWKNGKSRREKNSKKTTFFYFQLHGSMALPPPPPSSFQPTPLQPFRAFLLCVWQVCCCISKTTDHIVFEPLPQVHRRAQSRQSAIGSFSSRRRWDSPTPQPQASVPSTLWIGGGGTLACGRGVGGVPIPTREHLLWYSVYIM